MTNPVVTQEVISVAEGLASAYVPGVATLMPLIDLIVTAARAHFQANGTWPTAEEVHAALPNAIQKLDADIASWIPSNDGTLPSAPKPVLGLGAGGPAPIAKG